MTKINKLLNAEDTQQPMINTSEQSYSVHKLLHLDFDNPTLIKYSPLKCYLIMPLLTIATCFVIWIPIFKSDNFKYVMLFTTASRLLEASHVLIKQEKHTYIAKLYTKDDQIMFQFKNATYSFQNDIPIRLRYKPHESRFFQNETFIRTGLSQQQQEEQRHKYGKCQHVFEVPGLGLFLIDTLTGPFFILQYFNCLVYIWQKFYLFTVVMLGTSLITTFINYYLLRRSVLRIKESTEKYTDVEILCNGQFITKNSREIVPGDIIKPPKDMPCDALLIRGGVFVNQATLTGESLPIQKTAISKLQYIGNQKHWLYQGAIIVEQRGQPLALVIQTGFDTRKGQSFRKMLENNYQNPRFVRSGFLFMLEILIICSLVFGLMIPVMIYKKLDAKLIVMRFLDMLGWAVPPTFPIFFNICYSFTLYRLEKKRIFATEPTKTVTAGKLKNIYFDKTGTLTLNQIRLTHNLTFSHHHSHMATNEKFQVLDPSDLHTKLFSSCHSARAIDGKMMGDDIDVKMFEKSGYKFETAENLSIKARYTSGQHTIEALKINQYQSQYRSMSVLVRDVGSNEYYVFVKGAPEKIMECSVNAIKDYNNIVFKMSLSGLRLIAYGYKKIEDPQEYLHKSREEFESQLTLLGLMGFSNELRLEARQTIQLLRQSGVNMSMITGDNIWTAIEAAMRVRIIQKEQHVLVIEGSKQKVGEDLNGSVLSTKQGTNTLKQTTISIDQFIDYKKVIAVDSNFLNLYPDLITSSIKVFARAKPQTKLHIVNTIQNRFEEQWLNRPWLKRFYTRTPYCVAMVGDGANDVMAIKEANVGIGINDCDSSFASDYSIDKLTDVEYILRNGKSTLSIILDIFRYYGSLSVLKFATTCIMSFDRTNYNDNQFTYFNYMQTLEIVVFMSLTLPTKYHNRYYPNDNLLSLENHLIFHGLIVIPTLALLLIYLVVSRLPGYVMNPDREYSSWQFMCMTNTVLALASQCFYVGNAFLVYTSWPWKQKIWKNTVLMVWLLACALSLVIFFCITDKLSAFFGYVALPTLPLLVTVLIVMAFQAAMVVWNWILKCLKLERAE